MANRRTRSESQVYPSRRSPASRRFNTPYDAYSRKSGTTRGGVGTSRMRRIEIRERRGCGHWAEAVYACRGLVPLVRRNRPPRRHWRWILAAGAGTTFFCRSGSPAAAKDDSLRLNPAALISRQARRAAISLDNRICVTDAKSRPSAGGLGIGCVFSENYALFPSTFGAEQNVAVWDGGAGKGVHQYRER